MIKVSVMYPSGEGKTFDMDYYLAAHMDIVERDMGVAKIEVDKSVDGPYLAVGHLYFSSLEAMQSGMGNAGAALADMVNFTNTEPVVQTSEVVR